MSSLVYRIHRLLSCVLSEVGIGTNLDLFLLLWTILSGRLLQSRGGVIPALSLFGLSDNAVRRCWAALGSGRWAIADLIEAFGPVVVAEGRWQPRRHGGFHPVAGDLTGFFRPCLRDCPTKHYCAEAGKALPAIPVGLLARVGTVGSQRLAVPMSFLRADPDDPSERGSSERGSSERGSSERGLLLRLLHTAKVTLHLDEVGVFDRGFPLQDVLSDGPERFVVRLPKNVTARRATLPAYKGVGRPPRRGELVRPLPRSYKGCVLSATPPDREETWTETTPGGDLLLRAAVWDDLVLPNVDPSNSSTVRFRIVAIFDPRFAEPLLLATCLPLSGADLRGLYLDRWPIEGLPQVAKVVLGGGRQFVFAKECRQRLPELVLLAGSLLSYLAATHEAVPTGFWDRKPKPTAGRLRRVLATVTYEDLGDLPPELCKKNSPTAHLPKGVQAHRRRKRSWDDPLAVPSAP
jgi:hypothetical protein